MQRSTIALICGLGACGPPTRPVEPARTNDAHGSTVIRDHDLPGKPLVVQEVEVPPEVEVSGTPSTSTSPARKSLSGLLVKKPIAVAYYSRKEWRHWIDEDHDCQDTRQEVLIEESEVPVTFKTERQCKVLTGQWTCPYTGELFTNPSELDVDHMVPLAAAHAAGGHGWDAGRRRAFSNELAAAHHLIAVKASANRSKGKKGPEEWLPPEDGYICDYVRAWIDIKFRWDLSVSIEEHSALETITVGCDQ